MAIELACPNCRKRLKAPPGAEGKRFKCPHCQEVVIVPGAAADGASAGASLKASGSSNVAALYTSSNSSGGITGRGPPVALPAERTERWFVKTRAGADYGPISRDEMDRWVSEDRLDSESQILREGASQWQWASDLYPRLYPTPDSTGASAYAAEPRASSQSNAEPDPSAATGVYDFTAMSPPPETAAFEAPAVAQFTPGAETQAAALPTAPPPEPSVPLPTNEPLLYETAFETAKPHSALGTFTLEMLPSDKSKAIAGILAILVGGLGVHRFYLGYANIGVVQILVTLATCGLGAWWGMFEGFMILMGQIDRDARGRKLRD